MTPKRTLAVLAATAAALLPVAHAGRAQSASDHATSAHGKPIVNGHDVQPTPDVVQERWRHHRLMLKAQRDEAAGRAPPHRAARTGRPQS